MISYRKNYYSWLMTHDYKEVLSTLLIFCEEDFMFSCFSFNKQLCCLWFQSPWHRYDAIVMKWYIILYSEDNIKTVVLNSQREPQAWTLCVSYGVDFMEHFGENYRNMLKDHFYCSLCCLYWIIYLCVIVLPLEVNITTVQSQWLAYRGCHDWSINLHNIWPTLSTCYSNRRPGIIYGLIKLL